MLNPNKYPNEIKIAEAISNGDGTYSIILNNIEKKYDAEGHEIERWSLLKTDQFELNTYYKIQIRLTKAETTTKDIGTSTWFNSNLENFSRLLSTVMKNYICCRKNSSIRNCI